MYGVELGVGLNDLAALSERVIDEKEKAKDEDHTICSYAKASSRQNDRARYLCFLDVREY